MRPPASYHCLGCSHAVSWAQPYYLLMRGIVALRLLPVAVSIRGPIAQIYPKANPPVDQCTLPIMLQGSRHFTSKVTIVRRGRSLLSGKIVCVCVCVRAWGSVEYEGDRAGGITTLQITTLHFPHQGLSGNGKLQHLWGELWNPQLARLRSALKATLCNFWHLKITAWKKLCRYNDF